MSPAAKRNSRLTRMTRPKQSLGQTSWTLSHA